MAAAAGSGAATIGARIIAGTMVGAGIKAAKKYVTITKNAVTKNTAWIVITGTAAMTTATRMVVTIDAAGMSILVRPVTIVATGTITATVVRGMVIGVTATTMPEAAAGIHRAAELVIMETVKHGIRTGTAGEMTADMMRQVVQTVITGVRCAATAGLTLDRTRSSSAGRSTNKKNRLKSTKAKSINKRTMTASGIKVTNHQSAVTRNPTAKNIKDDHRLNKKGSPVTAGLSVLRGQGFNQ